MRGGWRRWRCWLTEARLPKLNENQTAILAELAAVGGRMRVRDLRIGVEPSAECRSRRWVRW